MSYQDRLVVCGLPSLELRRLRADIILCFKIVHKLIALNFEDFFKFDANVRTRGHNLKLIIPLCVTTLRHNFFAARIVPVWNSLPVTLVNCKEIKQFKKGLKSHDLSLFLKRNYDNYMSNSALNMTFQLSLMY